MAGIITSRRRWYGLLFLLLALGMVIWGQTWLSPYLQETVYAYVLYWILCLVWTMLALITALIDARVTRRQLRRQQLELLRETFDDKGREDRPEGSGRGVKKRRGTAGRGAER